MSNIELDCRLAPVTLSLPMDMLAALDAVAERQQRTRSNLVRVLLSQALSREPEAAEHE
jgi:metal-responsive CopG/Arc/MetJ family transcriptional regulator